MCIRFEYTTGVKAKDQLRTIRFTPREAGLVNSYLRQNPLFESFSSLARVATLNFIREKMQVHLNPIVAEKTKKPPWFLWDYDISETQMREILGRPGFSEKKCWLLSRILTQARFEEVFTSLDIDLIKKALPHLRLPEKKKQWWEYAIQRWNKNE